MQNNIKLNHLAHSKSERLGLWTKHQFTFQGQKLVINDYDLVCTLDRRKMPYKAAMMLADMWTKTHGKDVEYTELKYTLGELKTQ